MADEHNVDKSIKLYWIIFFALLILTGVTVAASYISVSVGVGIVLALIIATFKGSLVCAYFMHLLTEKKIVLWVLLLTLLFFIPLMTIPILWDLDKVQIPH